MLALVNFAGSSAVAPAHAQEETEGRTVSQFIGIVDMKSILQRSNAIASIRKAIDEQNSIFQSDISNEEVALRNAEKQLNEDKGKISKEEFNSRLEVFEERVIRLQRSIQAQKNSFDRSYAEAQERLENELLLIISEIAKEKGFAVVIQRKNAVIYDAALDISEEALSKLNERTRNLKITLEKKEKP